MSDQQDTTQAAPPAEQLEQGPPVTSPIAILGAFYTALAAASRYGSGS